MIHFIQHLLGLDSASGPLYLFWSGFFGDITILGGAITIYYHHNCHISGCRRWGKHQVEGSPYCTKHKLEIDLNSN